MQGVIKAVCISEEKGTEKHPVESAHLTAHHGIDGDAHAGPWHRQVSLLSWEKVEEFNRRGAQVTDGAFGENLLVSGIDFRSLPIGTVFTTEQVELRLTQIGKECHSHCAIFQRVGSCIMPHEGVFAEVLRGGTVAPGEILTVHLPPADDLKNQPIDA
ncbi:MAG: MOSC domain-containing protein [Ruminococcaceae bacterium]|nr:MOSC domain-containing protein [Oscillospiraceae bacterium]